MNSPNITYSGIPFASLPFLARDGYDKGTKYTISAVETCLNTHFVICSSGVKDRDAFVVHLLDVTIDFHPTRPHGHCVTALNRSVKIFSFPPGEDNSSQRQLVCIWNAA